MQNSTFAFNPHDCPVCVAILRLPHRGAFADWEWRECRCGYSIRRYPCGHAVYLDLERGDRGLEEHSCPEPLSPWRVERDGAKKEPSRPSDGHQPRRGPRGVRI